MGHEFKLETYDSGRTDIGEFLQRRPDFLRKVEGAYHLGPSPDQILVSVTENEKESHIYICQHLITPATDALLWAIVQRVLSLNDHVVISEI